MPESVSKKEQLEIKRQEKEATRTKAAHRKILDSLAIWGVVFLILGGIIALIWNLGGSTGSVTKTFNGKVGDVVIDDHVTGSSISTITLVEYSDFQCPACRAAEPFVKDILKKYGNQIRVVYRHFPLVQHQNAKNAAFAAVAAANQGKFWEMHDMLFDNQGDWSEINNAAEIFSKYATVLGLNVDQFNQDSKSSATKDRVNRDLQNGISLGINSTPTFYLNNYQLNLPNFSAIRTAVDEELNKK